MCELIFRDWEKGFHQQLHFVNIVWMAVTMRSNRLLLQRAQQRRVLFCSIFPFALTSRKKAMKEVQLLSILSCVND